MMQTTEIPREQWNDFFDRFSRQHEGWLATLEVFGAEVGAQEEGHHLPFEGVSVSSTRDDAQSITISVGKTAGDHISHTILNPAQVWLEQTSQGAHAALEIKAADDSRTLLRFRSPIPPEFVDGVVLE